MFKIIFIFFVFFLNISYLNSSSTKQSCQGEILFLEDFFLLSPCFPRNVQAPFLKDMSLLACSINVAILYDPEAAQEFIQNPDNWSEDTLHQSLLPFYPFKSNIKVSLFDNLLVIDSPHRNLIFEKLFSKSYSLKLKNIDDSPIKPLALPRVFYSMSIDISDLKKETQLRPYLEPKLLEKIINEVQFKKEFISKINALEKKKKSIYFLPFKHVEKPYLFVEIFIKDYSEKNDTLNLEIIEKSSFNDEALRSYILYCLLTPESNKLEKLLDYRMVGTTLKFSKGIRFFITGEILKSSQFSFYVRSSGMMRLAVEENDKFKEELVYTINRIGTLGTFNPNKVFISIGDQYTFPDSYFIINVIEVE